MQMTDVVAILRRRIGDTDSTAYTYSDTSLEGYIADAVMQVELEWFQGIEVTNGLFNVASIDNNSAMLYAVRAHYLIAVSIKDQADRNNFLMKKGNLTLNNSHQSKDHLDTINNLILEYKRLLYRAKNGGSLHGLRME